MPEIECVAHEKSRRERRELQPPAEVRSGELRDLGGALAAEEDRALPAHGEGTRVRRRLVVEGRVLVGRLQEEQVRASLLGMQHVDSVEEFPSPTTPPVLAGTRRLVAWIHSGTRHRQ